jgi:hypothetical protein
MKGFLLIMTLLAVPALSAAEKTVDISAAYSFAHAVATFPDPLFVGETDYLSSPAHQVRLMAKMENIFPQYFQIAYQGISVRSVTETRQNNVYRLDGYYSSFLQASSAVDSGILRWHFGFAALMTLSTRSVYDTTSGTIISEPAIDTRLSQAYPSGGFTLFPKAPIRFSMTFLNGDANLLYGWLRLQVEFEFGDHTIFPSVEVLNHASFGKGLPNFVQPPGAFVVGYAMKFGRSRIFTRLGFVLNSTQGFESTRVNFFDRLIFEFGAGHTFRYGEN